MKINYYVNENGPTIADSGCGVIEKDGLFFRNCAKQKELLAYEDWRLSDEERAKDLAARLSTREIAGLMLYSSHQSVPSVRFGPFVGHYDGEEYKEGITVPYILSDEQKDFISNQNIRHFLQRSTKSALISAKWSNELQSYAEKEKWGIPINVSSDPRHAASFSSVEFKSSGADVSKWPQGIGLTATFSPEICNDFAKVVSKEYRAMGITTALGPQIDLATEPRWMRAEDTYGGDKELSIKMTKAYCDGMQTTEGEEDGWGRDSVVTMAKHWPGGGTGEAGRDAHYPYGKFAVYPGNNFDSHKEVFERGAFSLDGPTKCCASIMPYYTVSWNQDKLNGKNEGNSYNEYIIGELLRKKCEYDGVVCTDWGITADPGEIIDSFSSRCFGVEHLSEAQRHLQAIISGVDQFGGNNKIEPVLEAYKIGVEMFGEEFMKERFQISARRLLTNIFRLGLFENPYLNPEESDSIVGCDEFVKKGFEAQKKSVVLLKDKNNILPLKKGVKVYIPQRHINAKKGFMRFMEPAKQWFPVGKELAKDYFEYTDNIDEADVAIVFTESPISDGYRQEDGYLPIMLTYREYTATTARETSIAGGDFREESNNRSYYNKTNKAHNESDLDNILITKEKMGDKPVIVCMHMHNPTIVSEFESKIDALVVNFGVEEKALYALLFGEDDFSGRLPVRMPKNMETIESHCEDLFNDYEVYEDELGNKYDFGYSLKK